MRGMRGVAAWLALVMALPAWAQPTGRELWVGVLTFDGGDSEVQRPRAAVGLRPAAALIDGTWRFDDADHSEPWTSQQMWEPAARRVPQRWRGWFADGARTAVTTTGALHPGGLFALPTIVTTLRPRFVGDHVSTDDVLGVAVVGRAGVARFAEQPADVRSAIPLTLRVALRRAERTEVERVLARGERPSTEPSSVPWTRLDTDGRGVEMHRVLEQPGGGRIHAVETEFAFDADGPCQWIRAGGMLAVSGAGKSTVLAAWASCGGPSVLQRPLAAIERDGRTCWLYERYYEDGIGYLLTPPKPLTDLMEQPACDIR